MNTHWSLKLYLMILYTLELAKCFYIWFIKKNNFIVVITCHLLSCCQCCIPLTYDFINILLLFFKVLVKKIHTSDLYRKMSVKLKNNINVFQNLSSWTVKKYVLMKSMWYSWKFQEKLVSGPWVVNVLSNFFFQCQTWTS